MEVETPNLTPKQEKAIMALLAEPTIKQAAETAGIGETTLHRWLNEEDFSKAYKTARKNALGQTISRLQQVTTEAVDTLKDIMANKESPASSRVTAARTVLEMAFKAFEVDDLTEQLEELEQYIKEQGK